MHALCVIAPGDMAAVKGGRSFDWTNHSQQEKRRHAKRSWSHAGVKGQTARYYLVLPVFQP